MSFFFRIDRILGVRDKCTPDGLYVCLMMKEAKPETNGEGRSKGLTRSFGWRVVDGVDETGSPRFLGLTYRSGVRKDPPLFINYCPWCGADMRPKTVDATRLQVKT